MSRTAAYVAAAVVADGCAGLVGGLIPDRRLARSRQTLLGFASGVLLGTTFLDLLPQAFANAHRSAVVGVMGTSLGIMAALEWALGRRRLDTLKGGRLAAMLLGADAFHNAADGAAIAAAFLVSTRLGVVTAVAVIAHEVPEELADYVLLRNSDLTRAWALVAMTGVQLTAAVGAVVTLLSAAAWQGVSGLALAVAAGTFLYIAFADLLPFLWRSPVGRGGSRREAGLGLVVGLVVAVLESIWS